MQTIHLLSHAETPMIGFADLIAFRRCALCIVLLGVHSANAYAGLFVHPKGTGYRFLNSNTNSSGAVFIERDTLLETQFVRDRDVTNRYQYWLAQNGSQSETLHVEVDAYSNTYLAGGETPREGGEPSPIYRVYSDTEFDATIDVRLERVSTIELLIDGEAIAGTPAFSLEYFGRLATYGFRRDLGTFNEQTNFVRDPEADDPAAVMSYHDRWLASPGTYRFRLSVDSTIGSANELLDAQVRILLSFTPILAGDYNGNGIVDAADYTVWRDSVGEQAGILINDVDGGAIGPAQYATWKAKYGATQNSEAIATPEPSTILLLLLVVAISSGELATTGRRVARS